MKALFIPISITVMIISSLFASCGTNKKMQASTPSTKSKKSNTVVDSKKQEALVPKTESIEVPPVDIKNNFSTKFPSAENPSWNKQTILTDASTSNTSYKVIFVEAGKKNWITYSDQGTVLEERQ